MRPRYDPDQVTTPLDVAFRATKVGVGTAVPGFIWGAAYGTVRTSTPVLFSIFSGAQCFAIGLTFWTVRSSILNQDGLLNWYNTTRGNPLISRQDLNPTPKDRISASVISGAVTGTTLGLLFRGPRNVIPGTIMFSLFGWGGQHAYNYLDQRRSGRIEKDVQMKEEGVKKENFMERIARSKWSPMTHLTDEEYERMIGEKILSVEVDIALIDDRIEEFRKRQRDLDAQKQREQKEQGLKEQNQEKK